MTTSHPSTRKGFSFLQARSGLVAICALITVTASSAQVGVVGNTGIDTSGNYGKERAWCHVNTSGVALTDCLKNSGAAQAEKRKGTLHNGGDYEANAMRRCEPFMGEDLAACRARVVGRGGVSGSVQGGGQIKQVETVVMPKGKSSVTFQPKTSDPVILVPVPSK